ncbi:MAG: AraC family transcriptional regulator [Eubacteriales bacterium]|nr:AraC family transcriptional regulator [Eubacteriales bacterium]
MKAESRDRAPVGAGDEQEALSGKRLVEISDVLNKPQEAMLFDTEIFPLPVRPHWHYYMEIMCMIRGSIQVESDGETAILHAGDFYMVFPETVHAMYAVGREPALYEVLKFDVNKLHSGNTYAPKLGVILRSARNAQKAPMLLEEAKIRGMEIAETMRRIREELERKEYGYDILVQSSISSILVGVLRVWRREGYNLDSAMAADTEGVSIHNITAYIDDHAGEDLKVEQLAAKCSMSYSYFAKSFHSLYGRSCKEYIELIRICKAEDLLLFTDCDLSYISQETGFADSSHLIKTFRKLKGITPKQYKTRNKG